jgi:hypothetical protein
MQVIGCSAPNNNKAAPGPAVNSQHVFACAPRMSDLKGLKPHLSIWPVGWLLHGNLQSDLVVYAAMLRTTSVHMSIVIW